MTEKITVQIDPELKELVPSYLQNLQANAAKIKASLKETDMDQCRRLGHNMKGSGGSYGFEFVSAIGQEIEKAALSGEEKQIADSILRLEGYLGRVDVQYGPAA